MKKDSMYSTALKSIKVHSSVAIRQAQGHLVREFNITLRTAAKATDRIFNGSTDSKNNAVSPLLELSECKTFFVDVDQVVWYQKRADFVLKAKAQDQGVLVYLSSARHKRKMKEFDNQNG